MPKFFYNFLCLNFFLNFLSLTDRWTPPVGSFFLLSSLPHCYPRVSSPILSLSPLFSLSPPLLRRLPHCRRRVEPWRRASPSSGGTATTRTSESTRRGWTNLGNGESRRTEFAERRRVAAEARGDHRRHGGARQKIGQPDGVVLIPRASSS